MTSLTTHDVNVDIMGRCVRYLPEVDTILKLHNSIRVFGGAIRFIVEQILQEHVIDKEMMCGYVKNHDLDISMTQKGFKKLKASGYRLVQKEVPNTYTSRFSQFEMKVKDNSTNDYYKYDIIVYENVMCYDFGVNSMTHDIIKPSIWEAVKNKELVVFDDYIIYTCTVEYAMKLVLRAYKMRSLGYHHKNVKHFQRKVIYTVFRGFCNAYKVDGYSRNCIKHIVMLDPLYDEYKPVYDIEILYTFFLKDIAHIIFAYLTSYKVLDYILARGIFQGVRSGGPL